MSDNAMTKPTLLLCAVALLLFLVPANPASAQHVIPNPGRCAQSFPNANCQNYGRGNPYTSYGWRRTGHHRYWGHHHHRRHWH
jgi:hypothetical protein